MPKQIDRNFKMSQELRVMLMKGEKLSPKKVNDWCWQQYYKQD